MSHGKQFTLYSQNSGPNGWKVAFLLEELGLTYHTIYLDFGKGEHKAPEFTKYNPNGRIPAIIDHKNNDFVLWESNAILQYIVDKYDTESKFTAVTPEDKYTQLQWLFFQASGQGPYFGQAMWFKKYHPERVPSAVERYQNETRRVISVLESVLSKQEWLVGGKYTIADMSFLTWHIAAVRSILLETDYDLAKEAPNVASWVAKIEARPAIQKVTAIQAARMAA